MAAHSSILAWRIPWTEEPGGYGPWGHRVGLSTHMQKLFFTSLLLVKGSFEPVDGFSWAFSVS